MTSFPLPGCHHPTLVCRDVADLVPLGSQRQSSGTSSTPLGPWPSA